MSSTDMLVHPNIKKLPLDVTDDSQVQSVVASIIEESGQIDMLINNAGVLAPGGSPKVRQVCCAQIL
jgi:NADP-dependent 3-hydroxy acid dehydrogenase YdfG